MRYNKQSTDNDCIRACVASLLSIKNDRVPNFVEEKDWWGSIQDFLRKRKMGMIQFAADQPVALPGGESLVECIGFGITPQGKEHAVVGVLGANGFTMVHDPSRNGEGSGMTGLISVGIIVPLLYGQSN